MSTLSQFFGSNGYVISLDGTYNTDKYIAIASTELRNIIFSSVFKHSVNIYANIYGNTQSVYDSVNNILYICCGTNTSVSVVNSFVKYDLNTGIFTELSNYPTTVVYNGIILYYDTNNNPKILGFGGQTTTSGSPISSVYEYDPSTDTWIQKTAIPTTLGNFGYVLYNNGGNNYVFVFGGYDGSGYENTPYIYDIANDSWSTKTSGATTRLRPLIHYDSDNNKMIILGGYNSTDGDLNDTWEYDISGDSWTQTNTSTLPFGIYGNPFCSYKDSNGIKFMVYHGYYLFEYNYTTNVYTTKTCLTFTLANTLRLPINEDNIIMCSQVDSKYIDIVNVSINDIDNLTNILNAKLLIPKGGK